MSSSHRALISSRQDAIVPAMSRSGATGLLIDDPELLMLSVSCRVGVCFVRKRSSADFHPLDELIENS